MMFSLHSLKTETFQMEVSITWALKWKVAKLFGTLSKDDDSDYENV